LTPGFFIWSAVTLSCRREALPPLLRLQPNQPKRSTCNPAQASGLLVIIVHALFGPQVPPFSLISPSQAPGHTQSFPNNQRHERSRLPVFPQSQSRLPNNSAPACSHRPTPAISAESVAASFSPSLGISMLHDTGYLAPVRALVQVSPAETSRKSAAVK